MCFEKRVGVSGCIATKKLCRCTVDFAIRVALAFYSSYVQRQFIKQFSRSSSSSATPPKPFSVNICWHCFGGNLKWVICGGFAKQLPFNARLHRRTKVSHRHARAAAFCCCAFVLSAKLMMRHLWRSLFAGAKRVAARWDRGEKNCKTSSSVLATFSVTKSELNWIADARDGDKCAKQLRQIMSQDWN